MFSSDVMMFTRSLELSAALSAEVGDKVPIDLTTTTPSPLARECYTADSPAVAEPPRSQTATAYSALYRNSITTPAITLSERSRH